jgi:hypothetical protein
MDSKNPQPLTLDEHAQLGQELRAARVRLQEFCALVVEVYGSESAAGGAFLRVVDSLRTLCERLQAQAEMDHALPKHDRYYT